MDNVFALTRSQVWQIVADVLALGKPRIVMLLAITCAAGYAVATKGNADLFVWHDFVLTLLGLSLSAMGANTVNMWWDRDIDPLMRRTATRPIPAGRISPAFAVGWGAMLGIGSFMMLYLLVNPWTATMSLSGYLFYVLVYTMWLKRSTVQNIVIGGAAGAFPPLVGWAAVQGDVAHPLPWILFAIIFFWTPPHFWALALLANKDYARAGIPMLPVVKGVAETKLQMLYYLLILLPVSLLPALFAPFGYIYLFSATGLGLWWLAVNLKLLEGEREVVNPALTRQAFMASVYYLALLFAALVADTYF
ncbi:MAG: heme o synthase [Alphaproteobacteria bacterium]